MADSAPHLSHNEMLKADRDPQKSASVVNLIYVRDTMPGISRQKKGKGFSYRFDGKALKDKNQVARIKKLAIPPAWSNVWICRLDNGHIQATGLDLRKRKQYRYHALWNMIRNETKFHRLYEFGKILPQIRLKIEEDLKEKELTQEKVLATIISLMEQTYIRIGNSNYEKLYGSYGMTTLKDKHVSINRDKIHFAFRGKKGIHHNITLRNKRLARAVEQCRDIPGRELFQYYDEQGSRRTIESGMVNDYIRSAIGMDFTAKDFRTWAGTLHALKTMQGLEDAVTPAERKKNMLFVLDSVSKQLGNTRTVCKKYYVHPRLMQLYEENNLAQYISKPGQPEEPANRTDLSPTEKLLLKILSAAC